ncbi:helix-turn-helix domain-containing protein [Desulfobacter vibrioformis]|uniref:helix-turn-helix domain-containing protein n=1 Tax=Desulfobacter vibrioformis TaxID=34031 RepID=UPI000559247C|nr:helix-turn-helix domain-containing protein [Desulfobacter vibrioformis]
MQQPDPFRGVKLCSSKDVRKILGVSRGFVQRIIAEKMIPAQKVSGGWIFPKSAVLEFQQKRIQKAKTDKRVKLK